MILIHFCKEVICNLAVKKDKQGNEEIKGWCTDFIVILPVMSSTIICWITAIEEGLVYI